MQEDEIASALIEQFGLSFDREKHLSYEHEQAQKYREKAEIAHKAANNYRGLAGFIFFIGVGFGILATIITIRIIIPLISGHSHMENSTEVLTTDEMEETYLALSSLEPGMYCRFGKYEQDGDLLNGMEDIEWLVLTKEEGRILVISRFGLECGSYNDERIDVIWETSTLRKWLNQSFFSVAFSNREEKMIEIARVTADRNPHNDIDPGNDTEDKVFLLSIQEVEQYFNTDEERRCGVTPYTISRGAYNSDGVGWWWLRSPGRSGIDAALVDPNGGINVIGSLVNDATGSIRPALWIKL